MAAARVADESRPTFEMLERRLGSLPPAVQAPAVQVLSQRSDLIGRMLSLSGSVDLGRKIRIHGDYHLGQVLWAEDDFYILDFEGEPDRPLDERRAKQSPLKDVAGMVRSFGYAAAAALHAFTLAHPMDREDLAGWAKAWRAWTSAAFLRGYLAAVAGASILPPDRATIDTLLAVFILEKALYELRYELNHRPDWVSIPLSGLVDLLGR
jgi:maltose alpha-D-glucosyltransferase/alpha-amylase